MRRCTSQVANIKAAVSIGDRAGGSAVGIFRKERSSTRAAARSAAVAPHLQAISGMVGGGSGPFSIFLLDSRAIASNKQQ